MNYNDGRIYNRFFEIIDSNIEGKQLRGIGFCIKDCIALLEEELVAFSKDLGYSGEEAKALVDQYASKTDS